MQTKFTRAGSSVAVIIPSSDLKRLGIKSKEYKNYTFDMRVNEDSKTVILSDFQLPANDNEIPF